MCISDPTVTKEPFPEIHILSSKKPLHSAHHPALFPVLQKSLSSSSKCCFAQDPVHGTRLAPSDQTSSSAPAPPPSCQNAERHKNKPIHSRRGKTHWLQRLSLMQSPLRSTERKMVKQKSPSQEELCATEAVAAAGCFLGLPSSPCNPSAGKPAACRPRSAKMWAASHVTSVQMI